MLMAACCEDDIVIHVLPFVKNNIKNPDWRYRDAAVMAFGKDLSALGISVEPRAVISLCLLNKKGIARVVCRWSLAQGFILQDVRQEPLCSFTAMLIQTYPSRCLKCRWLVHFVMVALKINISKVITRSKF